MSIVLEQEKTSEQNIQKREANFELLRIVSMFLIIVFHFNDWGGISNITEPVSNKLFGIFINVFFNRFEI